MADKENKPPAEDKPQPKDRQVKPGHVKVRALHPLGEETHHAKGEVFETSAERAKALGPLVEIVK